MGFRACSVFVAALVAISAFHATQATAVVSLTEATFDKETQEHVWFIKFFAPWCGHCKKLAPIYAQLPNDPQIAGTDVRIGEVDCTKERSICERFDVQSYPTLKVVADGRYYEYNGRREAAGMIKFIQEGYKGAQFDPVLSSKEFVAQRERAAAALAEAEHSTAVVPITSATFETLVKDAKHPWMLKFYAPWCGHCKRLAPTWHELGKTLQEAGSDTKVGKVDCTVHRRVCSRFGVNGYPTLLYIRDGKVYKYDNPRTLDDLVEFASTGWKSAEPTGPIPDESLLSSIVDSVLEWTSEHTILAILLAILCVAVFVALLVALLDYCLGEDDVNAYRELHRAKPNTPAPTAAKAKDD